MPPLNPRTVRVPREDAKPWHQLYDTRFLKENEVLVSIVGGISEDYARTIGQDMPESVLNVQTDFGVS